ncbi:SPOR domain-containing protein [Solilutibacter silvestris]|uniref:SPOR domain-containing protein n=1 Tax=Solilutibacter silvestris TaxID=1645665 RepID=UPI003D32DB7B
MDRPVKQRLWGAAVLIALAVIFLPMLVKGPAPDSGVSDVPLDSPKAPDATVKTQELPLDVPGAVGANGATGMPAAQANADTPANATAATATPAPNAATAATDAKPSPATAAGDYAVSFGSYGSSSDADRVVQAVTGIKLHGYSEKVSLAGRDAWRVRIGPYPTREAAEVARVQAVQLNPQVKAQVIALDANAAQAPVPTATASTSNVAPTPAIATAPIASSKPADKPVEAPKPAPPVAKPDKAITATKPAKPAQSTEPKPVVAQHQDTPTAPKPDTGKHDQPKPEPKPADKPAASGTGFAVQLGAFANAAEATALRDKARAAGFSATTDTVKTDKGVLTRVRLGPVVGRDAANALKTRAQATLGVSGIVRPSP